MARLEVTTHLRDKTQTQELVVRLSRRNLLALLHKVQWASSAKEIRTDDCWIDEHQARRGAMELVMRSCSDRDFVSLPGWSIRRTKGLYGEGVEILLSEHSLKSLLKDLEDKASLQVSEVLQSDSHGSFLSKLIVEADDLHYSKRSVGPGTMHGETEEYLKNNRSL